MKKLAFIPAVFIVLAFCAVSFAAIPVEVSLGKETILSLKKPSKRVSLADPSVVQMTVTSPTEILLNGKKAGVTSLIAWDTEGKATFFDVVVIDQGKAVMQQRNLQGLERQIKEIAPDADIKVEPAGDAVFLKGELKNEETKKKIEAVAAAYGKVVSHLTVPEAQQVVLEVRVAQINKTKLKELGLSFLVKGNDGEFTSPGFVASPDGGLGGEAGHDVTPDIEGFDLTRAVPQIGVSYFPTDVSVFLRALASKGFAKILAEPNLAVRSGEKGQFHVGTRFPVQTVTGTGANATVSVTYEDVGVRLNFAPDVLETGTIRLKVDPAEVSNIQDFVRLQNLVAPIIDTRTVRTSVDLKEGESLILAGLLSEEMIKNIQKIPLLGDIPILGAIFRSTTDELREKELAFFITPRFVKPMAPGTPRPAMPGDNRPTPEEEREFQWIPFPEQKSGEPRS
jgi:pilus assembly protein CpaC